jgi:hypothetical protein
MAEPKCANGDHAPRAAAVRTSWPDGRFKPGYDCRSCLRNLITWYVTGGEDGQQHALLIEPLTGETARDE